MNIDNLLKKWQLLDKSKPGKERVRSFLTYCEEILQLRKSKDISIREGAYKICGAIQFDDLINHPQLGEVIDIACDLELPDGSRIYNRSQEELWGVIEKIIFEVKKTESE